MKPKISTSFMIFLIALFISIGTFATSAMFMIKHVNMKYAIYLGLSQSIVAMITPLGIYIGVKSAFYKFNKLGLWGNVALFLYTAGIIVYSFLI